MKNQARLIISNHRIKNLQLNKLKLSKQESHYLNKVMRLKKEENIFILNGKGYLWKGIKKEDNYIEIPEINNPILFQEQKKLLLGIAIALPKKGFEDILKMCTEIGIDLIQPLYSEYQVKKIQNEKIKMLRWNAIINEAVEQCERLWKPDLLSSYDIYKWINSVKNKNMVSVSVTKNENCEALQKWLKYQSFSNEKKSVLWNVIGPEGGWSEKELCFFEENNMQFIKLSESILRTSTAAVSATTILSQWRDLLRK